MRFLRLTSTLLYLTSFTLALSLPPCQEVAPPHKNLTAVRTAYAPLKKNEPFGIVYATHEPHIAFVALNATLGVLSTKNFVPELIHQLPLPYSVFGPLKPLGGVGGTGIALTHDGRYLLVTAFGPDVVVFDTHRAAKGRNDSMVGILNGMTGAGNTAIEITISPDDRWAYVSIENGNETVKLTHPGYALDPKPGRIETFALHPPRPGCEDDEPFQGHSVGFAVLEDSVVGSVLSKDGKYLYATSEDIKLLDMHGTLAVLSTEKLKQNASDAVLAFLPAGCEPVRTLLSSEGEVLWVSARSSNALLAFNTSLLLTHPNNALLATVQTGTQPVGLVFVRNESRIITADSDRSVNATGATAGLSVIDVGAALRGDANANLGQIATGLFPRELAVSLDGRRVLVSDFMGELVQVFDVETLP
jgi:DNA-binding beta-propeller fold protein YncE